MDVEKLITTNDYSISIWLDNREFFNKKFENKLLKKVLKIQESLDKKTTILERKHWINIDLISRRWNIQWVNYIVSYRNYEKVLSFSFECEQDWKSFDIDIEFEITKNVIWNKMFTHTIYFEEEYLDEQKTKELKDKIEKLYYAMSKK